MANRDTDYAAELARATFSFPGTDEEARLERLYIKKLGQEEVRFSWWKAGRMAMRPLDLPEADLLELLREGVTRGVLSPGFVAELRALPDPPQDEV